LLRLVGFAVALYLAIFANDWAAGLIQQNVLHDVDPGVAKVVAYGAVFLAVYVSLFLITFLVERAVKAVHLKAVDRLLGALFGAAKAALLLGALFLGIASIPQSAARELMERSRLAPLLADGVHMAISAVPTEYKKPWGDGVQALRDSAKRGKEEQQ
jgi:membrane protein required for colicin V production